MADLSSDLSAEPRAEIEPGIIYISRIPPYMRPLKVRHYFSKYGKVGKIFLQPEEESVRQRRKKFGGNKKHNYTEGWVEFSDKRTAKTVASLLNNNPVGGKKRSYYHDDLWNIKYLRKFKWSHITEKITYDNAVRSQRMRTELSQTKKEINAYLDSVEKGRIKEAITSRKKKVGKLKQIPTREKINQKSIRNDTNSIDTTPQLAINESLLRKIISA